MNRVKSRSCSRNGCSRVAVSTLTYDYRASTAVVGPLALRAEPGCYDLCADHTATLSAPRGWETIRLPHEPSEAGPTRDDLMALADAIRRVGLGSEAVEPPVARRRGHLAVVADLDGRV